MSNIYDIKTGLAISMPIELTARQLADKLYELEDQLNDAGLEAAAKEVRKAIVKVMPRVIREKRIKRLNKQFVNLAN